MLYSELRGMAHLIRPHPYYLPQLGAERLLFGGHVPTVELQHWLWNGRLHLYDRLIVWLTSIHTLVPPTLAFVFWLRNRALFRRFVKALLTLSFAGAVTFLLFPAAPPWAASRAGLVQPIALITDLKTKGHVPSGFPLYGTVLHNPYAAIPSLHAGYAFLVFLFVASIARGRRWRWPITIAAALYPLSMGFAVVYTGNHYVVDLVLGFAFAAAAFAGVPAWSRRRATLRIKPRLVTVMATVLVAMALSAAAAGREGPSSLAATLSRSLPDLPLGQGTTVDLPTLMPFRWTRVYIFGPGTQAPEIDRTLGFHWKPGATEAPGDSSVRALLLFVRAGSHGRHVVREATYQKGDPRFDCIEGMSFPRVRARFTVVMGSVAWGREARRALIPKLASGVRQREVALRCLPPRAPVLP
jgi:membrane-associated phospholipid phosphatase